MSATIDGASWKAIGFMREKPAALGVFWIYCSRLNKDNVAYPSLRSLARDTGWSYNTCREARNWLIECDALEEVPHYIRPEWVKLAEADRLKRIQLDRSEYYRPTGHITLTRENKTFSIDLLYMASRTAAPELDPPPMDHPVIPLAADGSPRDTPPMDHPVHNAPGDPELVTSSTELDSIKDMPASKEDAGAAPEISKPKRAKRKDGQTPIPAALMTPMKNKIAECFGRDWKLMTDEEIGQIQKAARQLCKAEYTPDDVPIIYDYCVKQPWDGDFGPMALTTNAAKAIPEHSATAPRPATPAVSSSTSVNQFTALTRLATTEGVS